jgi:hypothetical protein
LLAAYLIEAGLVLMVTPWSPFWLRNYFAHAWPWLGALMQSPYMRGAVTGVGLITAITGFRELVAALAARRSAPSPPAGGQQP